MEGLRYPLSRPFLDHYMANQVMTQQAAERLSNYLTIPCPNGDTATVDPRPKQALQGEKFINAIPALTQDELDVPPHSSSTVCFFESSRSSSRIAASVPKNSFPVFLMRKSILYDLFQRSDCECSFRFVC